MKKLFSMLLALSLMGALLAACNKDSKSNDTPKEFRFTLASEPSSLDPSIMTDAQSSIVASGLYEGMMRLSPSGQAELGVAEAEPTVSDDGKTYTFKLRKDAKWSNGDPVTAHDFEYTWKRTLSPETAADYAYMLFYIENGENYNAGKATADQVGVKAKDDHTLEVKLNSPTPYFVNLLCHYSYWPVHKGTAEAKKDWAAEASTIVSNGPFLLKEWEHGAKLVLEKNPDYFNKDKVNFTKVTISLVEEDSTVLNLFQTDKIDWIGAQAGAVALDQVAQLIADGSAKVTPSASTYYYQFNTTKKPFNNAKVRKAFSMAIDRQAIIDTVTKANQEPAHGLVASAIEGLDGKKFRQMYPDTDYLKEDAAEAKKLLAEGLAEEGMSALPETKLLYNTSDAHKAIAEAIVDMWRKNLGVEVKLTNQEFATYLETKSAQQFDVARAGWGADINHPINFTYDLIHSKSGNNDGKYNNPKVDQLIDESLVAADDKTRFDKLAEAERIAISEDMALMPIYYYTSVVMQKPGFKDVVSDYAGHLDWAFGDKE